MGWGHSFAFGFFVRRFSPWDQGDGDRGCLFVSLDICGCVGMVVGCGHRGWSGISMKEWWFWVEGGWRVLCGGGMVCCVAVGVVLRNTSHRVGCWWRWAVSTLRGWDGVQCGLGNCVEEHRSPDGLLQQQEENKVPSVGGATQRTMRWESRATAHPGMTTVYDAKWVP